jgi:nucleoside 2-deoxyribosyltransferase
MDALEQADRCILVLPSGRSAHLEAGYAIGKGKPTAIWVPEYDTPDLMVKMADYVSDSLMDILGWLGVED